MLYIIYIIYYIKSIIISPTLKWNSTQNTMSGGINFGRYEKELEILHVSSGHQSIFCWHNIFLKYLWQFHFVGTMDDTADSHNSNSNPNRN